MCHCALIFLKKDLSVYSLWLALSFWKAGCFHHSLFVTLVQGVDQDGQRAAATGHLILGPVGWAAAGWAAMGWVAAGWSAVPNDLE